MLGSWNIHKLSDSKLENAYVYSWIIQHDIILISEIKTLLLFNVPGYKTIMGNHKHSRHGGIAMLIRNCLFNSICHVDKSCDDQLWFKLSFLPDVLFGGCYILPSDSIHYTDHSIANIQAKCFSSKEKCIIFGDINARCGESINELVTTDTYFNYTPIDNISRPNSNGSKLLQVCKDCELLVINNLSTCDMEFKSALTFRKKDQWISEVDLFIVARDILKAISGFQVNQSLLIPSDHAPISMKINSDSLNSVDSKNMLMRAKDLGEHAVSLLKPTPKSNKPIMYRNINQSSFLCQLETCDIPVIPCDISPDTNVICEKFASILYQCSVNSREYKPKENINVNETNRWKRILDSNDSKVLWQAINWNGHYDEKSVTDRPADSEFQEHLEELLCPTDTDITNLTENSDIEIPILDCPIDVPETVHVIEKQLNPYKSCGLDGISPGVFRILPNCWILFFCMLLNLIFLAHYPISWTVAKLNMLYKKGNSMDCNNYRGISIINSMAKIYDYILNNRLTKWYSPQREQSGAQAKRGCIEQIVTLRLIMDYCFRKKQKLYVAFIDFSKAYDRVPRSLLFSILRKLGCGAVMLAALVDMYSITQSVLGSVSITANLGVRQGSPTSCLLFIIFVDMLIKKVKSKCDNDGFLSWLHLLMLMDDTVILATSRDQLRKKLQLLHEFCEESGMVINEDKTKFMVIHGTDYDRLPMYIGSIIMKHCNQYVYLGVIFTSDGSALSSLKQHVLEKKKHLNKLIMFFFKNQDMPFVMKKKVLDAAFSAALLYGCEAWLNVSLKQVENLYHTSVKSLLGVRNTTGNNLCLLELGYPPLKSLIQARQHKFLKNAISDRKDMSDDPLMFALQLTEMRNHNMWEYISGVLKEDNFISKGMESLKTIVKESERTKSKTYLLLNPNLSIHSSYLSSSNMIPEYLRIVFSRFRLSSHRLRIETGRWARIPPEDRLCQCGGAIQTEEHVLVSCPLVQHIRDLYSYDISYPDFLENMKTVNEFTLLYKITKFFED